MAEVGTSHMLIMRKKDEERQMRIADRRLTNGIEHGRISAPHLSRDMTQRRNPRSRRLPGLRRELAIVKDVTP